MTDHVPAVRHLSGPVHPSPDHVPAYGRFAMYGSGGGGRDRVVDEGMCSRRVCVNESGGGGRDGGVFRKVLVVETVVWMRGCV